MLNKLQKVLNKTSSKISSGLSQILSSGKISEEVLEDILDTLIMNDLGVKTATLLVDKLREHKFGKQVSEEEIKEFLRNEIQNILEKVNISSDAVADSKTPNVILVMGTNGSGKTTTIAKLGYKLKKKGKKVLFGAGDTFRAAAIEQLKTWGERLDIPVIAKTMGSDPAALAFEAFESAKKEGFDTLIIDTAGRLQNKKNLMIELEKIVRVLKKIDETAPHESLLVLDSTIGQNAFEQVKVFNEVAKLSGIIATKLDGSSKGGTIVGIVYEFNIPIKAIGIGESMEDLQDFNAEEFARSLL